MKQAVLMETGLSLALALLLAGCGAKGQPNPAAEAPPAAEVEREQDANMVKVDHPEQFPLATASAHVAAPELNVTGVVSADVSRNVPVISLASGRVVKKIKTGYLVGVERDDIRTIGAQFQDESGRRILHQIEHMIKTLRTTVVGIRNLVCVEALAEH